MEHRWNARKQVDTKVVLHSQRHGLIQATACDVSHGGMCLETKWPTLSTDCMVRVIFTVRHDMAVSFKSIDALVVHTTGPRCGLMFSDYDQDVTTFLDTLLDTKSTSKGQSPDPLAVSASQ